jgi:hypothetical protein
MAHDDRNRSGATTDKTDLPIVRDDAPGHR